MNNLRPNVICIDRRKKQRRELRGLQTSIQGFEPNPFSRRMGTDRRGTIVVYGPHAGLSVLIRSTMHVTDKVGM